MVAEITAMETNDEPDAEIDFDSAIAPAAAEAANLQATGAQSSYCANGSSSCFDGKPKDVDGEGWTIAR